jgi:hypothetical protein
MSEIDEEDVNIVVTEYKMKYLFTSFDQVPQMPSLELSNG